jgi:hypothetical protein
LSFINGSDLICGVWHLRIKKSCTVKSGRFLLALSLCLLGRANPLCRVLWYLNLRGRRSRYVEVQRIPRSLSAGGNSFFKIADLISHEYSGLGGLRDGRLPLYVNAGFDPDRRPLPGCFPRSAVTFSHAMFVGW